MNETLLKKTMGLLQRTDIPLATICLKTGVKLRWLHRLVNGDFTDPGVNKIERLHSFLVDNAELDPDVRQPEPQRSQA